MENKLQAPTFIGIGGKKTSGKDTVANIIAKKIKEVNGNAEIVHIATPLKRRVAQFIENREADYVDLSTFDRDKEAAKYNIGGKNISWREALQKEGALMREIYGEDVWINKMKFSPVASDVIIVPDIRYANEVKFIQDKGGVLIYIERPSLLNNDKHPSENSVDATYFDHTIVNEGPIEELEEKVLKIVNEILADATDLDLEIINKEN